MQILCHPLVHCLHIQIRGALMVVYSSYQVGIEDPEDLIKDMRQALDSAPV